MLVAAGSNQPHTAALHLTLHALAKAALFLTAGTLIHRLNSSQMRSWHSLSLISTPMLHICLLINSLALSGLPGLAPAASKDSLILASQALAFDSAIYSSESAHWLLLIGIGFSIAYSALLALDLALQRTRIPRSYAQTASQASQASPDWLLRIAPVLITALGLPSAQLLQPLLESPHSSLPLISSEKLSSAHI